MYGPRFSVRFLAFTYILLQQVTAGFGQTSASHSSLGGLEQEIPVFRGLDAHLYMQTSAEYRAACYQAFNLATEKLNQALRTRTSSGRQPAVVMDLDETVLDNGMFQSWMVQSGIAYQQDSFDQWEQHGGAFVTLIPGAKEFILAAEKLGVRIVHISNRNNKFREQTKQTLARLGIPIQSDTQLKLFTDTTNKTTRRLEVDQKDGCETLLYVGDNLRDFDERFRTPNLSKNPTNQERSNAISARLTQVDETRSVWGSKWIVLPNPAYGEWHKH